VHPDWNWLPAITRLIANSSALVLLYPFALSFSVYAGGNRRARPGKGRNGRRRAAQLT
jgi:hypothetical protein